MTIYGRAFAWLIASVSDSSPNLAGCTLAGCYRLLSSLGSGGMSSVWRARDLTLIADVREGAEDIVKVRGGTRCRNSKKMRIERLISHWRVAFALALAGSLHGASALALDESEKESVRALSEQAAQDFKGEHYELARDKFAQAYALAKVPKLAVWLGRSNERLGKLVTAAALYREARELQKNELWTRHARAQAEAQDEAAAELSKLAARIPKLQVAVDGAPLERVALSVDGTPISVNTEIALDPGVHEINARFGEIARRENVTLRESEARSLVVHFDPPAPAAPSSAPPVASVVSPGSAPKVPPRRNGSGVHRSVGFAALGAGAVGLLVGSTAGVLVMVKNGELESNCGSERKCGSEQRAAVESYDRMRTISTIGFVTGGLLAATGITLILTSPREGAQTGTLALSAAPGGATLQGEF